MKTEKRILHSFGWAMAVWLVIIIMLFGSCASYRTEPYKPSMNPVKNYHKAYNK